LRRKVTTMSVLSKLPTSLTEVDFFKFAPIEVLTVESLRQKPIKQIVGIVVGVGAALVVSRGLREAQEMIAAQDAETEALDALRQAREKYGTT